MNGQRKESDVIGIALIGIGRIGKVHAWNIRQFPKVQLLYIIDVYKQAAEEYIAEYGLTSRALHTDELNIAYDDERVDAFVICCPTQSHEKHVKAALNKGKAVMCEKPLAFALESIVDCYKVAEMKGKPLFCAFNRRFDPQTASIHSRIPEVVGKVKSVKTVSRDHELPSIEYLKESGGIVIDSCIHDIDMLLWMTGQIPETIYAIGHAHIDAVREIGDVDQLYVTIKFFDGAFGHIDLCREATFGHDQRLEVFGNKGMLTGNNVRPQLYEVHTGTGSTLPPIHDSCMTRYNESYRREMMHFVDAVRGHAKLKVSGDETIWTTICCLAANESLSTGQPVNVKEFSEKKFSHVLPGIGRMSHKRNGHKNGF